MQSGTCEIEGPTPTEEEIRGLLSSTASPQRAGVEIVLQHNPDPGAPGFIAAAYLAYRACDGIHTAMFRVEDDIVIGSSRTYQLRCKIAHETESPGLATCPSSLLDQVDRPASGAIEQSGRWRERCRDFELSRRIAGGDREKTRQIRALQDEGRLIFSRVG